MQRTKTQVYECILGSYHSNNNAQIKPGLVGNSWTPCASCSISPLDSSPSARFAKVLVVLSMALDTQRHTRQSGTFQNSSWELWSHQLIFMFYKIPCDQFNTPDQINNLEEEDQGGQRKRKKGLASLNNFIQLNPWHTYNTHSKAHSIWDQTRFGCGTTWTCMLWPFKSKQLYNPQLLRVLAPTFYKPNYPPKGFRDPTSSTTLPENIIGFGTEWATKALNPLTANNAEERRKFNLHQNKE